MLLCKVMAPGYVCELNINIGSINTYRLALGSHWRLLLASRAVCHTRATPK